MCPPISFDHRNIEININDNRHFALPYLLGITRPTFTWSQAQEPSIHTPSTSEKGFNDFFSVLPISLIELYPPSTNKMSMIKMKKIVLEMSRSE